MGGWALKVPTSLRSVDNDQLRRAAANPLQAVRSIYRNGGDSGIRNISQGVEVVRGNHIPWLTGHMTRLSCSVKQPTHTHHLFLSHSALSTYRSDILVSRCQSGGKSSCSIGASDARASLSPGKSGEVAQGLGACRTSSPMTLTENARRRLCPPTPAEACKVNMLKHTMSPGDNVHPRMGKSSRWLSISGSSPSVPSENHLAWLSMKDRGISQGPLCEPAMNSRQSRR